MGKRAAAEAAEPENEQFSAFDGGHAARANSASPPTPRQRARLRRRRYSLRRLPAGRGAGDQLDTEREPPLVDQPPDAVEANVIRLPPHRLGQKCGELVRRRRHCEARASNRPSSSSAAAQLVGKSWRMGEHLGEQLGERRARLEQPEQVHPARQPLNDVAEPIERVIGIAARRNRLEQARKHRFEGFARRVRAQRPRLSRPPVADDAAAASTSAKPSCASSPATMSGSLDRRRTRFGCKAVEDPSPRCRRAAAEIEQSAAAVEPVQKGDIVERAGSAGSKCVCASSIICTRCSTVRSRR